MLTRHPPTPLQDFDSILAELGAKPEEQQQAAAAAPAAPTAEQQQQERPDSPEDEEGEGGEEGGDKEMSAAAKKKAKKKAKEKAKKAAAAGEGEGEEGETRRASQPFGGVGRAGPPLVCTAPLLAPAGRTFLAACLRRCLAALPPLVASLACLPTRVPVRALACAAAEAPAAGGKGKKGPKVSAAVRRMQEAIEAQRRAQEEAERLAEEQRRKVGCWGRR